MSDGAAERDASNQPRPRTRARVSLAEADRAARAIAAQIEAAGATEVIVVGEIARRRDEVAEIGLLVRGLSDAGLVAALKGASVVSSKEPSAVHRVAVAIDDGAVGLHRLRLPWRWAALLATCDLDHATWLTELAEERGVPRSALGAVETDEQLYALLGLPATPPELREGRGVLPDPELVRPSDVRGLLHAHTLASDGRAPLSAVIREAIGRGYSYIGISDHFGSKRGISREGLAAQAREIEAARRAHPEVEILHGLEVDLEPDGGLAADEGDLRSLDFVIASVHTDFSMTADRMTARLVAAAEHPLVTVLGHPTGRLLGARPAAALDVRRLAKVGRARAVALEINGYPTRLDPPSELVRSAAAEGASFLITADAHDEGELAYADYATGLARRANLARRRVINTLERAELVELLRERRARALGGRAAPARGG